MCRKLTTYIPVKSYVYKFIVANHPDPIQVDTLSNIGEFLYSILLNQQTDSRFDKITEGYAEKIVIKVPPDVVTHKRFLRITSHTAIRFNSLIENEAKKDLYYFAHFHNQQFGITLKECILYWMEQYKITEDDITYDGLWKSLERMRKSGRFRVNPLFWKNFLATNSKKPSHLSVDSPADMLKFQTHARLTGS